MSALSTLITGRSSNVGCWALDESAGTSATDLKNARSGTYTGGYTLNQGTIIPQVSGGSFITDDSTGYVTIPDHNDYSVATTGKLTVRIWARVLNADEGSIVSKAGAGSTYEWHISALGGSPNTYRFEVWTAAGASIAVVDSSSLTNGTDHMFAFTADDGTDTLTAYIDGVSIGTDTTWSASATNQTGAVNIGRRGDNPGSWAYYGSRLQMLAIDNDVLSAAQLLAEYTAGTVAAALKNPLGAAGFFGV
jgi:hypothetical protein